MRALLVALLFFASCRCEDRIKQVTDCGKQCYPGNVEPIGECQYGIWACDDDGGITCQGAVTPLPEQCNGLDDDCNGKVDDRIWNDPHTCTSACGLGIEQCFSGRWTECSAPKPKPEVCNGRDDDCDGKIDEIELLPDGGYPLTACFEAGPPANPFNAPCHPGALRCVNGQQVCDGQQLPTPELCDGIDNDCDGEVDEGAPKIAMADIVIVFDNSGSMATVAAKLRQAASNWVAKYQPVDGGTTDIRFALVAAPHIDMFMYQCHPVLVSNFTDAMGIQPVIALQNGMTGSGEEATLNALNMLLLRPDSFGLMWRSGAKRVIVVFSDEPPQGYYSDCVSVNPLTSTVISQLMAGGVVLHVFTATQAWSEWRTLATAGGGQTWDILGDEAVIEMQLDSIIDGATCGLDSGM